MTTSKTTNNVIYSEGSLCGLPSFTDEPESRNLTALVTGANGISGYHLVRVLAANPKRWGQIYCLSRREPPENFLEDLGEGSACVKHIAVDFLSEPAEIADRLVEKVQAIDHVFFFSYMQTEQKGSVLGMWSDASALADLNSKLLTNFLDGIRLAGLQPKRFLLQTGAKNYGFHMGPATNPSFETDPRISLEANFYYPQEDALKKFCEETGTAWNVVRPSYIIGAVRDGALNCLIGLAIYGAVQSYLDRPLEFPGDYAAWDREFSQSTALLNAHFEEWAVLTDQAANEAFNIQDGQSFTWGRFWPYLASWFGTTWNPPDTDMSKYRVTTCRHVDTPRGYGPRGVTRSTFSLLEWSENEEVQQAWRELSKRYGLVLDPFDETKRPQIFGMTDSAVLGDWPLSLSMRKARKMGFFGTADSFETSFEAIQNLARLKLVVPTIMKKYIE